MAPPPPPTSLGIGCHGLVGGPRSGVKLGVSGAGGVGFQVLRPKSPRAGFSLLVSCGARPRCDPGGALRPLFKPACPFSLPREPGGASQGPGLGASVFPSRLSASARDGWAKGAVCGPVGTRGLQEARKEAAPTPALQG